MFSKRQTYSFFSKKGNGDVSVLALDKVAMDRVAKPTENIFVP